ncbi:MAG: TonB-dependent receptor [Polyangiaceae bacterium]|nr:TonB-dependent receptor [Polyangiaceae bacterium]
MCRPLPHRSFAFACVFALAMSGTQWARGEDPVQSSETSSTGKAPPPTGDAPPDKSDSASGVHNGSNDPASGAIDVLVPGKSDRTSAAGRSGSRVDRRELAETLPRSAPDALRYEPGVYVQQTAHGQGSPFVRGRTGQQVLLMVDGVRLNNSTFRQGPNQYFFTVDARSIHSIDVIRGGASTQYGSDALAGVIQARPIEPTLDPNEKGFAMRPRVFIRGASADTELGFRMQLDAQYSNQLRFIGGFGSRKAEELRASGPVCGPNTTNCSPTNPAIAMVPRFEPDGRTQVGTGYREITGDARLVYSPSPDHKLIGALYLYRQYDSPRTDQCPPPFANRVECLTIDEQFRTLTYLSYRGRGPAAAQSIEATVSFQRQHERRTRDRPQSFIENGGRDAVNTFGVSARVLTELWNPLSWLGARFRYGGDLYDDRIESKAWTIFTDNQIVVPSSRGQYLAGSSFTQGGLFADAEFALPRGIFVRAGARTGFALAAAPGDPASGTLPVNASWPLVVGHIGVESMVYGPVRAFFNYDRSYRTPNLDDLTSRQQAGPGFQLENPNLRPETADTIEGGLRLDLPYGEADVWGYASVVYDSILRIPQPISACPPETPQCNGSWARYQLVNLEDPATIVGFEASARFFLPHGFDLKATLAYAFGESPNPAPKPADPAAPYESTLPLSRIPPLNGTAEIRWEHPMGMYLGAALRWATAQDRLALTDRSDARIPPGGTPGFAVFDARAGYRFSRYVALSVVVENLGDTPYRYHGSSINGPERGFAATLDGGL